MRIMLGRRRGLIHFIAHSCQTDRLTNGVHGLEKGCQFERKRELIRHSKNREKNKKEMEKLMQKIDRIQRRDCVELINYCECSVTVTVGI